MVYPNATRLVSAKTQSRVIVTLEMVCSASGEGVAVGVVAAFPGILFSEVMST